MGIVKTNLDSVHSVFKRINKWVGFFIDEEAHKKTPVSILDWKTVGANDTDRLVSFEKAAEAYKSGNVDAIGISLDGEGITCIDIDYHDPEKKEKFEELNKEVLDQFNSYAETSISGKGTHIYIMGKKPAGYKHSDKFGIIEVYDCVRFVIVTGNAVEGHDTYFAKCQEELNSLCEKHLIKKDSFTGSIGTGAYIKSDEEVIKKICSFKKGNLFYKGDWDKIKKFDEHTGTYAQAFPSQSEADFSFAGLILWVNGNNPEQALRIFMGSGMWGPEREKKKSSGYLQHTIAEASLRCNRVYEWDRLSYTDTEKTIDFDEVMSAYVSNQLVAQAKNNSLVLVDDEKLNQHLAKYILNFGSQRKDLTSTLHLDLDSSSNGFRFWLINCKDLIYLSNGDEWLKWTGKCWERCFDKNLLPYAEKVFYQLKHEAYNLFLESILDIENKDILLAQALSIFNYTANKSKKECADMIPFAKTHFIKAQNDLHTIDKLNENMNVLNLKNGVFDFDNMKFYPHSKDFYQTKIAGVDYKEDADCPLWKGFIEMVLPYPDVQLFFQKAVGYTLSSRYMEKCMFILYGEHGNNGKTTIVNVLHKLMGDYAVVAEKQTIMDTRAHNAGAPRPDLLRLRDRRFVAVSENEKDDKLAEGLIKNLTGGGLVICRTLHQEPVEFPALFKIWLDTNYKPQIRGTDKAIWRRLKVIEFPFTIPSDKIDTDFGAKLEKELPGILNWGIEGYKLYLSEGLEMPDSMKEIMEDYAEDMSPLDQWIKECVDIWDVPNDRCIYTSKTLFPVYINWCKYNREFNLGQRRFTQEINTKNGFLNTKKVKGYTKYLNVSLNEIGLLFCEDITLDGDLLKRYEALIRQMFIKEEKEEFDRLKEKAHEMGIKLPEKQGENKN